MTMKKRSQRGLGWAITLVLVTSGLVVAGGLASANADDPAPSPTPTTTASADPTPADPTPADPTQAGTASTQPSGSPSDDGSASAVP
ncbi:MAG: hypothetical protein JWO46_109, partial [Nocardioidaceae bacterium]|nr:hypothetical protein [Nocardioidaceae bacterium]